MAIATVFASSIILASVVSVDTIKQNYVRLQSQEECAIMIDDLRNTRHEKEVVDINTAMTYSVTYNIGYQTVQHTVRCIPLQKESQ